MLQFLKPKYNSLKIDLYINILFFMRLNSLSLLQLLFLIKFLFLFDLFNILFLFFISSEITTSAPSKPSRIPILICPSLFHINNNLVSLNFPSIFLLVGYLSWPLISVFYECITFRFLCFYVTNHITSSYFTVVLKYFPKPFFSCLVI